MSESSRGFWLFHSFPGWASQDETKQLKQLSRHATFSLMKCLDTITMEGQASKPAQQLKCIAAEVSTTRASYIQCVHQRTRSAAHTQQNALRISKLFLDLLVIV